MAKRVINYKGGTITIEVKAQTNELRVRSVYDESDVHMVATGLTCDSMLDVAMFWAKTIIGHPASQFATVVEECWNESFKESEDRQVTDDACGDSYLSEAR